MSFLNKRFSLTENFGDKNLIALIKSSHDINNCLTNCSNNGCCKLKDENFCANVLNILLANLVKLINVHVRMKTFAFTT